MSQCPHDGSVPSVALLPGTSRHMVHIQIHAGKIFLNIKINLNFLNTILVLNVFMNQYHSVMFWQETLI